MHPVAVTICMLLTLSRKAAVGIYTRTCLMIAELVTAGASRDAIVFNLQTDKEH